MIGTLAAGDGKEAIAQNGFTRLDKTRCLRDQVHVDAADDNDACHALLRMPKYVVRRRESLTAVAPAPVAAATAVSMLPGRGV